MRAFVSGSDTLRLHYNIAVLVRQCCPQKKYLSEWMKSDIIPTYSIRDLQIAVPVSVFHSIQEPVGLWMLFSCPEQQNIPASLAIKRTSSNVRALFYIYILVLAEDNQIF